MVGHHLRRVRTGPGPVIGGEDAIGIRPLVLQT